jgi:hypothetical protein
MARPNSNSTRCRRCGWPRRSNACATARIKSESQRRAAKSLSRQSRHPPPTSPRARPLPKVSSRPAASRRRLPAPPLHLSPPGRGRRFFQTVTPPRSLAFGSGATSPDGRTSLPFRRSKPPARRWPASVRRTRSMPNRRSRRQKPFKPPAPNISIWQGGPASRKPRSVPPALTISSSPAAMRWRRCRRPIG